MNEVAQCSTSSIIATLGLALRSEEELFRGSTTNAECCEAAMMSERRDVLVRYVEWWMVRKVGRQGGGGGLSLEVERESAVHGRHFGARSRACLHAQDGRGAALRLHTSSVERARLPDLLGAIGERGNREAWPQAG